MGQEADRKGGSLWSATATPAPQTSFLRGDEKADVVVIGGGFCGLSCALHLAEASVGTVLLEAEAAGWGASGRNGGQIIPCFKDDPETLVARLGPDLGERMSRLGAAGGKLVADLIKRHGIECAYRQNGWIYGVHGEEKLHAMEERACQWEARGRRVRMLDRGETAKLIGTDIYEGGYLDPEGGALNPLSFARGLAGAAIKAGAQVYTASAARKISRHGDQWRIECDRGAVTAGRIVLASGAYSTDLLPEIRRSVLPVQSIQIATPPLSAELRAAILSRGHVVSDTRRLLIYFRFNEEGRLVFGGRGALAGERITAVHVQALYAKLRSTFPVLGDVGYEYVWAGLVDVTVDRNLRVHRPAPGMVAVIGFNGRGVAIAPSVGRAIAEAIVADSFDDFPLPVTPAHPVPFHGMRLPAMAMVAQWYRLLDRLESR